MNHSTGLQPIMHENSRIPGIARADGEEPAARAVMGLNWRLTSSAVRLIVEFVVMAILAHLLPPKAFGVLGFALIVTGLATTMSTIGIGPAVVQHPNLTNLHVRVAFTLSLIIGVLVTTALWVMAPFVAVFFRTVEVIPVVRLVSFSLLFASLGTVSRSLLLRKLEFRKEARGDSFANLVVYAPVAIGLGFFGFGVWAPAAAVVAREVASSVTFLVMAPHPKMPLLSRREVSEVLRFGVGASMTRIANFAAGNADYVVVGSWLGAEALGLYQYAYRIAYLPISFVTGELSYVLFPAMAALRSKHSRLQSVYRGALVLVVLIALPSAVAIAVSAQHLVPFLFGNQWAGSVGPLQILCIGGVFQAAYNLSDSLARASGAVYQQALRHLIYATTVFAFSLMGTQSGLAGVAVGVVAAIVLINLLMSQLSARLLGSSWLSDFRMYLPGLLVGLAVGAGGALPFVMSWILKLPHAPSAMLILLGCAAGALSALVGIPARWLGSDVRERLSEAANLLPYATVRSWLLKRIQGDIAYPEAWPAVAKGWSRKIPGLAQAWVEFRLLRYAVLDGLWRAALTSRSMNRSMSFQGILTWDVKLPQVSSATDLERWFTQRGVTTIQGGNTLYLPPQKCLRDVLGDWISLYPPDAGLKILRDLRPPEEAWYLSREWGGPFEASLVGTPADQLVTANFLYAKQLSPRVYDLCCLRNGATRLSAFVVQHIDGQAPSEAGCRQFLSRLEKVMEQSDLKTIHPAWRTRDDFQPPACNGNLLVSPGSSRPVYVDFQSFRLVDSVRWRQEILEAAFPVFHFADEHASLGDRYAYQSIPGLIDKGKRHTSKRWAGICEQLERNGLKLRGRLILDVRCNAGMMMAAALRDGALWGLGWDLPPVIAYAEPLLLSLGLTRFNLIRRELHRGYDLQENIPDHLRRCLPESVVFYLAVKQHIGVMECLPEHPWRAIVYEGHEGETLEDLERHLAPLLRPEIRTAFRGYIEDGEDGDGCRRPLVLLVRGC